MHRKLRLLPFLVVLGIAVLYGACNDLPTGYDEGPVSGKVVPSKKLRFANLLRPANGPRFNLSGTGTDSVSFVIGLTPDAGTPEDSLKVTASGERTLQANRIIRRYRIYRRYRIIRRYSYDAALNGEAVTLPAAEYQAFLDSLETMGDVKWAEPDFHFPVYDLTEGSWTESDQKKSWGIGTAKADNSYYKAGDNKDEHGRPGNVDLYILDSGAEHPDLNVAECLQPQGSNFVPCTDNRDYYGHGTAVAGIAAAIDNRIGLVGTAPGAPVRLLRVLNSAGYTRESTVIRALELIIERKRANPSRPVVVNMSLGSYVGSTAYTALDEAVSTAVRAGIVVVVAAGNDGQDAGLFSPAHAADALTVGAYMKNKDFAAFSNRGSVVDVLAPGHLLEVLVPGTEPNRQVFDSGTSMAAPHVAGAAAILLSRNPTWSPVQVRAELLRQRVDIGKVPAGTTRQGLNMDKLGGAP